MHMSAELLLNRAKSNEDAKLRLMAENIHSSSSQMRAFVRAFLANAAADHSLSIKLEPISLADAATRVIKQYESVAHAKEIVIRTAFPAEPILVQADPMALDQVLDNLISNAIKFSPSGKEVLVRLHGGIAQAECHVCDQGVGFTEEDKKGMFHRYARLSARPTRGEPSTGLGLSIAKKLVQAMNGDLIYEGSPGTGATFIVRLPSTANKTTN
jgi:two-component system sensor histidine kinase/response regulator